MTLTNNNDQIHRFIFDNADIRGEIVSLRSSYQNACQHQQLPPAVKTLLGEFLAAASLLSEILKFAGTITIQAQGNGPIPLIMADTSHDRNLRGIAKLAEGVEADTLEGLTLRELIGDGVLTLTMDPENGQRYQGIIELEGANLADCLSNYFTQSEQLPTRLWLFSNQDHAGGLLLQSLPKQKAVSDPTEQWNTASKLANTAKAEELFELEHAALLTRLFSEEFTVRMFETKNLQFACQCSHERCGNTLVALGKADAFAILDEREVIEIHCEFCGTNYTFDNTQLSAIFTQAEQNQKEQKKKLH